MSPVARDVSESLRRTISLQGSFAAISWRRMCWRIETNIGYSSITSLFLSNILHKDDTSRARARRGVMGNNIPSVLTFF